MATEQVCALDGCERTPKRRVQKYCSRECGYASKRTRVERRCQVCNETFTVKPSYVERQGKAAKYCSLTCYMYVKRNSVERMCNFCGEAFTIRRSRIASGFGNYCSKACQGQLPIGTTRLHKGYILIKTGRGTTGWQREHRYVMEQHLRRDLYPHENVHHLDGNKANNDLSNLELWSHSQPPGQRVDDKIAWAIGFLNQYGYEVSGSHQASLEIGGDHCTNTT